jgi:hypothetical protein
MLFGDVLAVIAGVLAITLTAWATILAASLLLEVQVTRGQEVLQKGMIKPLLSGLFLLVTFGGIGIALLNAPAPFLKVLGMGAWGFVLVLGAVGAASLSRYLATRMRMQHPGLEEFNAVSRSALLIIGSSWLPLVGWFLVMPALLSVSIGAGWRAMVKSKARGAIAVGPNA